MIDYDSGIEVMEINCDGCSEADSEHGLWVECMAIFKEKGWETKRVEGEWENFCPACAEKNPLEELADVR